MPRKLDLFCNRCGKPMHTGEGTLPAGQARCRPCRKMESQRYNLGGHQRPLARCGWCAMRFSKRRLSSRYCSTRCSHAALSDSQRIRHSKDWRDDRAALERSASGLSRPSRLSLLAQWKRQGRGCVYCDALATTVDHVVPLVRGGTNYEGNLAPACRRCNCSKNGWTVTEWRLGKRTARMRYAIPAKPKQERKPKPKPKRKREPRACALCGQPRARRRYCSNECGLEANARLNRDRYRARHGLHVNPDEPTSAWDSRTAA